MAGCELMAIGDSLFNGVRSLSIDQTMAPWSAPAQLAKALGVTTFAVPDYPRNVVINFEKWLTEIVDVPSILADLSSNIAFWNTQPKSALPQFDNIAIASSVWSDLYARTWQTAQSEIEQINHQVAAGKTTYNDNLAALFFAFNTRFILNPTGNPQAPVLSPLQIAAERKPRRLLISIGANNGLWSMAFAGAACPGLGVQDGLFGPGDLAQLATFIQTVEALPPDIEHIYLNTLPLPSTAPNMMPVDDDFDNKPGPAGLYPNYENRFGFVYGALTGAQMAANNQAMIDLQAHINTLVTNPRIHFVPIDQMLLRYDFKTNAKAEVIPAPGNLELNNLMIDSGTDVQTLDDFWDGGFAGLDGLHPTIVGYNLMAQTMLDTIKASEPNLVVAGQLPTVAQAFAADTLLSNFPNDWDALMYAWRDVRQDFGIGVTPQASDHATRMQSLMKVVQFKTN